MDLIHFILKFNDHLEWFFNQYGGWTYALLFLIIFCETGLIVTPFLPGDSLLFAVGAMCASGKLDIFKVLVLLFLAAIIGDSVNYWAGRRLGRSVFKPNARILKTAHLVKTEAFYEKYGPKAIIMARFVPIVRTMAPFVAGLGKMDYARFVAFDLAGGLLWVGTMTMSGYFFGGLPFVKKHFEVVVLGIIVVSLLPAMIEVLKAKFAKPAVTGTTDTEI